MIRGAVRGFGLVGLMGIVVAGVAQRANAQACGPSQTNLGRGFDGACARFEDRLRLNPRASRDISRWDAPDAFAPMVGGPTPAHQRLYGGYGSNEPQLR